MGKPIRVLQVLSGLDRGGAEGLVMNLYRRMDRNKVQFDFVVNQDGKEYAYEKEILSLGGRVYRLPRFTLRTIAEYKKAWYYLLAKHPEWKLIHCHHTTPAFLYLKVIKHFNRIAIAHSHTGSCEKKPKAFLKYLMRMPIRYQADYLFACSKNAADWMFGKNNPRVHIVKNSIEPEKYRYDEEQRSRIRQELGLQDCYVVGHIGNFSKAKNMPFILKLFEQLHDREPNARLLLVGRYENDPDIRARIRRMDCAKDIILTGVRTDVPQLLLAMDVFLFPSLFEGLPTALIEAQASGLKCIASDAVTDEVRVTKLVEFLSLNQEIEDWMRALMKYRNGYVRESHEEEIRKAGYDIQWEAEWMENFYLVTSASGKIAIQSFMKV